MKLKRVMRSVKSNEADIKVFAEETASELFNFFCAEKRKSRELAKILTMEIFIKALIAEIEYRCDR